MVFKNIRTSRQLKSLQFSAACFFSAVTQCIMVVGMNMSFDLDGPLFGSFGIGKFGPWASDEECRSFSEANTAGYLPILGLLPGTFRLVVGVPYYRDENSTLRIVSRVFIVRGIVECLGAGIFFAPIDIGCSLARLVREYRDNIQVQSI
jgi:hypothetical protein